jgi:hypothetical protein
VRQFTFKKKHWPRVNFHMDKMIYFYFYNFKLLLLFHDLLWYCQRRSEIIQIIACHDGFFQHLSFIFYENLFQYFWRLFNEETDSRVKYFVIPVGSNNWTTNLQQSLVKLLVKQSKLEYSALGEPAPTLVPVLCWYPD